MISRNIGLSGVLVIGGLIGGATGAIADMAAPAAIAIAAEPLLTAAVDATPAAVTFEPWEVPDLFVIDVPTGWITAAATDEARAVIASYDAATQAPQPTDVATAIVLVPEPPETYVPQQLDALIEAALAGEFAIDRYGITSVGGNDAFRLWMEQMPGEFSRQVITFVGDGQGRTATIVSSYDDDSAATRELLVQMHGSFDFISPEE